VVIAWRLPFFSSAFRRWEMVSVAYAQAVFVARGSGVSRSLALNSGDMWRWRYLSLVNGIPFSGSLYVAAAWRRRRA